MNFFSLLLCYLLFTNNAQEKPFVRLDQENIEIGKEECIVSMTLPFQILDGYHIQPQHPKDENLIASRIEIESFEVVDIEFDGEKETIVMGNSQMDVLSDMLKINLKFKFNGASKTLLRGIFYYQPCDNRKWLFSKKITF